VGRDRDLVMVFVRLYEFINHYFWRHEVNELFNVVQVDLWLLLDSASLLHKRTPPFSQSAGAYLYENTGSEINNHRRECVVCLTRGEPHLFDLLHQRPSAL
jgi:hypothetical protein